MSGLPPVAVFAAASGRGPWRARCFLLLALVFVQADAHPPLAALREFSATRVLPVALRVQDGAEAWMARVAQQARERFGFDPRDWIAARHDSG